MELKIFDTHGQQSIAASNMMIEMVLAKPNSVLCLATGDSPKLTYELFVKQVKEKKIDLSECFFTGLDEWLGIDEDNLGSCHYFLYHYLFEPLEIADGQIHLFNAFPGDERAECKEMNDVIESRNGIDLMIVGIGMNGHVGFNEPGVDTSLLAHVTGLHAITQSVGQKYFAEKVRIKKGITQGLQTFLESRQVIMLAHGSKKSPIIKQTVEEDISSETPSTFIRKHSNGFLLIDKEAAMDLD